MSDKLDKEIEDKKDTADKEKKSVDKDNTDKETVDKEKHGPKAFDIIQIFLIIVLGIGLAYGSYLLYANMSSVRLAREMALAENAEKKKDYNKAIEHYEKAIKADSSSLLAYQKLVSCYMDVNDTESMEVVLFKGWQNTGDEDLLSNYISLKLNDVVDQMNAADEEDKVLHSFEAATDALEVLNLDKDNQDALDLLSTLYTYCMTEKNSSGESTLFWSGDGSDSSFTEYADTLDSMIEIYEAAPNDDLAAIIGMYTIPEGRVIWIDDAYVEEYAELLDKAENVLGEEKRIETLRECLINSAENKAVFDGIRSTVDDDLGSLRDFMVSNKLIKLRSRLERGGDKRLELDTVVRFSFDGVILSLTNNEWTYHYPDFDEYAGEEGIFTLYMEPDVYLAYQKGGYKASPKYSVVQMMYEPSSKGGYYPHMTYEIEAVPNEDIINAEAGMNPDEDVEGIDESDILEDPAETEVSDGIEASEETEGSEELEEAQKSEAYKYIFTFTSTRALSISSKVTRVTENWGYMAPVDEDDLGINKSGIGGR